MPFPYFIRKLFQNNGAGDKLREDILPKAYLPLTGGAMTGAISWDGSHLEGSDGVLKWKNSPLLQPNCYLNDSFSLGAGTAFDTGGASLTLWNSTSPNNSGAFGLKAVKQAGSGYVELSGFSNGALVWNGKNIVRSVNGQNADEKGNANIFEAWRSGANWYRVWSNGFKECGVAYQGNNLLADHCEIISLPIAFSDESYNVLAQAFKLDKGLGYRAVMSNVYGKTTTSVYCGWYGQNNYALGIYIQACGF